MARDFLAWRHLRVLRARTTRHVHRLAARLQPMQNPSAVATAYGVPMIAPCSSTSEPIKACPR